MSQFTTNESLIEDPRLMVSDDQVSFVVNHEDGADVYEMPASEYAEGLEYTTTETTTRAR